MGSTLAPSFGRSMSVTPSPSASEPSRSQRVEQPVPVAVQGAGLDVQLQALGEVGGVRLGGVVDGLGLLGDLPQQLRSPSSAFTA